MENTPRLTLWYTFHGPAIDSLSIPRRHFLTRLRVFFLATASDRGVWCRMGGATILLAVVAGVLQAADPHPGWTRLSPTEEIWVDFQAKKLVIGGRIAIDEGPIELLACPSGSKEHESIVAVNASPRLVYAGLLALGLEPGSPATSAPDFVAASGPEVQICIRWRADDGEAQETDAREWVKNMETGLAMQKRWVFAGGGFHSDPTHGAVVAVGSGADLISVANFPESMLDVSLESPSGNERLLYEVFPGRVPSPGTKVELRLGRVGEGT